MAPPRTPLHHSSNPAGPVPVVGRCAAVTAFASWRRRLRERAASRRRSVWLSASYGVCGSAAADCFAAQSAQSSFQKYACVVPWCAVPCCHAINIRQRLHLLRPIGPCRRARGRGGALVVREDAGKARQGKAGCACRFSSQQRIRRVVLIVVRRACAVHNAHNLRSDTGTSEAARRGRANRAAVGWLCSV